MRSSGTDAATLPWDGSRCLFGRDDIHLACCICNMYLCLRIGDLRAPHRHGKNHGRKIVHELMIM